MTTTPNEVAASVAAERDASCQVVGNIREQLKTLKQGQVIAMNHDGASELLAHIDALAAERDAALARVARMEADSKRLDWLEANCTEEPWNFKAYAAFESPDTRLKHKLPPLISTTCVNGAVTLRAAIDAAAALAPPQSAGSAT